jgi:hypothetical protein
MSDPIQSQFKTVHFIWPISFLRFIQIRAYFSHSRRDIFLFQFQITAFVYGDGLLISQRDCKSQEQSLLDVCVCALHSTAAVGVLAEHTVHVLLLPMKTNEQTPWPESATELHRPSDRRLSANWLPTFADKGCHVVSVTDPYCRILDFLDRNRYFSIK